MKRQLFSGLTGGAREAWKKAAMVAAFAGLAVSIVVLIYLNFFRAPAPAPAAGPAPAVPPGGVPEPSVVAEVLPSQVQAVTLYFGSPESFSLVAETRSIQFGGSPTHRAKAALEELLLGSRRGYLATIPQGTQLREVYMDTAGVVYVDLTPEVRENHPGGSEGELLTVYSIARTVLENVPESRGVRLLIGGREQATLAGHVDLTIAIGRALSDAL